MASQQPEENESLEVDSLELHFTSSEVDAPAQGQPGTTLENRERLDKAKMYAMLGADSSSTSPKSSVTGTEDSTFAGRERAAMDTRSIPVASHHLPCDQMPFGGERSTPLVGGPEAAAAPPMCLSQEPPAQDMPGDLSQDDVVLSFEDQRMIGAGASAQQLGEGREGGGTEKGAEESSDYARTLEHGEKREEGIDEEECFAAPPPEDRKRGVLEGHNDALHIELEERRESKTAQYSKATALELEERKEEMREDTKATVSLNQEITEEHKAGTWENEINFSLEQDKSKAMNKEEQSKAATLDLEDGQDRGAEEEGNASQDQEERIKDTEEGESHARAEEPEERMKKLKEKAESFDHFPPMDETRPENPGEIMRDLLMQERLKELQESRVHRDRDDPGTEDAHNPELQEDPKIEPVMNSPVTAATAEADDEEKDKGGGNDDDEHGSEVSNTEVSQEDEGMEHQDESPSAVVAVLDGNAGILKFPIHEMLQDTARPSGILAAVAVINHDHEDDENRVKEDNKDNDISDHQIHEKGYLESSSEGCSSDDDDDIKDDIVQERKPEGDTRKGEDAEEHFPENDDESSPQENPKEEQKDVLEIISATAHPEALTVHHGSEEWGEHDLEGKKNDDDQDLVSYGHSNQEEDKKVEDKMKEPMAAAVEEAEEKDGSGLQMPEGKKESKQLEEQIDASLNEDYEQQSNGAGVTSKPERMGEDEKPEESGTESGDNQFQADSQTQKGARIIRGMEELSEQCPTAQRITDHYDEPHYIVEIREGSGENKRKEDAVAACVVGEDPNDDENSEREEIAEKDGAGEEEMEYDDYDDDLDGWPQWLEKLSEKEESDEDTEAPGGEGARNYMKYFPDVVVHECLDDSEKSIQGKAEVGVKDSVTCPSDLTPGGRREEEASSFSPEGTLPNVAVQFSMPQIMGLLREIDAEVAAKETCGKEDVVETPEVPTPVGFSKSSPLTYFRDLLFHGIASSPPSHTETSKAGEARKIAAGFIPSKSTVNKVSQGKLVSEAKGGLSASSVHQSPPTPPPSRCSQDMEPGPGRAGVSDTEDLKKPLECVENTPCSETKASKGFGSFQELEYHREYLPNETPTDSSALEICEEPCGQADEFLQGAAAVSNNMESQECPLKETEGHPPEANISTALKNRAEPLSQTEDLTKDDMGVSGQEEMEKDALPRYEDLQQEMKDSCEMQSKVESLRLNEDQQEEVKSSRNLEGKQDPVEDTKNLPQEMEVPSELDQREGISLGEEKVSITLENKQDPLAQTGDLSQEMELSNDLDQRGELSYKVKISTELESKQEPVEQTENLPQEVDISSELDQRRGSQHEGMPEKQTDDLPQEREVSSESDPSEGLSQRVTAYNEVEHKVKPLEPREDQQQEEVTSSRSMDSKQNLLEETENLAQEREVSHGLGRTESLSQKATLYNEVEHKVEQLEPSEDQQKEEVTSSRSMDSKQNLLEGTENLAQEREVSHELGPTESLSQKATLYNEVEHKVEQLEPSEDQQQEEVTSSRSMDSKQNLLEETENLAQEREVSYELGRTESLSHKVTLYNEVEHEVEQLEPREDQQKEEVTSSRSMDSKQNLLEETENLPQEMKISSELNQREDLSQEEVYNELEHEIQPQELTENLPQEDQAEVKVSKGREGQEMLQDEEERISQGFNEVDSQHEQLGQTEEVELEKMEFFKPLEPLWQVKNLPQGETDVSDHLELKRSTTEGNDELQQEEMGVSSSLKNEGEPPGKTDDDSDEGQKADDVLQAQMETLGKTDDLESEEQKALGDSQHPSETLERISGPAQDEEIPDDPQCQRETLWKTDDPSQDELKVHYVLRSDREPVGKPEAPPVEVKKVTFVDSAMTKAVDDLDVHMKEEDRPVEETLQETEESVSKYLGAQQQEKRADDEFEIEFPNTASSEHTHASKALGADGRGSQLHSTPVTSDTSFGGHRIMVKKEETATSTGTVCHVEEASMVLERQSAQEEWDRVQTIEPVFARPDEVQRVAPSVEEKPILKYQQALEALSSADYSTVKRKIHAQVSRSGFQALKKFFFGPPKLHSHLWPEREMVFCFAGTPLQDGNKIHLDMLQSVYRQITGSRFECQRFGAHWESIGFQGNDPATDLRATGMLAVLQMMSLLGNPKVSPIARDAFRLSQDTYQNFPFCVIGINLTRTCLQILREDLLNRECNRQNSVINVMNEFYAGLFLKFYSIWKNGKTIIDSGHVMETINNFAKKNTKQVLVDLREHTSHSSTSGPSDAVEFTNVCSSEH